jgi:hypothetical protein
MQCLGAAPGQANAAGWFWDMPFTITIYLTHIAGDIACLSALTTTRVNEIETEDCASISFAMTSGALATSSITLGAAGDETRLRFVFEHLTATSGTAPYAPGAAAPGTFHGPRAIRGPGSNWMQL